MITPRRTRLVRVPDLHTFRRVLARLRDTAEATGESCAVIVPTRGASAAFQATMRAPVPITPAHPALFVTRDQLYDLLHSRMPEAPRRLTVFERDALAQASAHEAAGVVGDLPFKIRPGLVGEILRFYDQLRRQSQQTARFEELLGDALGSGAGDRGAERLLRQTDFLARTFRTYEDRVAASGGCDEHGLRHILIGAPLEQPLRHVIVTVPDWIGDPAGLFVADFDLLTRIPGLQTLDILATVAVLGSGFHERIHTWWPGLEEITADDLVSAEPLVRPLLVRPPIGEVDQLWFTYRDREDELNAVADRLRPVASEDPAALAGSAVVFKRPLPYLYLAPNTLGAAGIPYRTVDALPFAAEPVVATVDLVLDLIETSFAREALVALLGSPHLVIAKDGVVAPRESVAAMNRALSEARYLGGLERFDEIVASRSPGRASVALGVAQSVARELAPLGDRHPASVHLSTLAAFLEAHLRPLAEDDPLADRETRGRRRLLDMLRGLVDAHSAHHDPLWTVEDLAAAVRRWIGDETFDQPTADTGVYLLDDHAAPYGDFSDVTIVGLIEDEWPDRTRRNIFYPPGLLKALNWPSEKDRRAAADARFLDLLASSSTHVELSTFTLDDEALVTRSIQLDEVPQAKLSTITRDGSQAGERPVQASVWDPLRLSRAPSGAPEFHGATGPRPSRPWSISALETYLACPFKFYSQYILKLEEEPDDEEVMDPRRQGQFVHEVFETFFARWQEAGRREISAAGLPSARALFAEVVDGLLNRVSESEAGLERTRLLGSPAAAGLGEAVFRMEAEREIPVIERLLEHKLEGSFTIRTAAGPRSVALRGKVDRIDLLADGTFRLIDYKLGWPPNVSKALQLPIYAICAEQRLAGRHGRTWTLGEAVYLAFKGPKRVVPLFSSPGALDEVLQRAQQRLVDAIDAIDRGDFPPSPEDVFRCETCAFTSVCRKDYVGDV